MRSHLVIATLAAAGLLGCNAILGIDERHVASSASTSSGGGGTPRTPPTPTGGGGGTPILLAAGGETTCARMPDDIVYCWGSNRSGQLGAGSDDGNVHASPTPIAGLSDVKELAVGGDFSCALDNGGHVRCWGSDALGQLGDGDASGGSAVKGPTLAKISQAAQIDAGYQHVCVRKTNPLVACWGSNAQGQLGVMPDGNVHATPLNVSGLTSAKQVSAGGGHTCVVEALTGDNVLCWGANGSGQLGQTPGSGDFTPKAISGLAGSLVAVGKNSSCAVVAGAVDCWGANGSGQLGDGTNTDRYMPGQIDKVAHADMLALSRSDPLDPDPGPHACALSGGEVWCWGADADGEVGNVSAMPPVRAPVKASLGKSATAVAVGYTHTCAVLEDATIWCWGGNTFGQLGDGTSMQRNAPVRVHGLP